MQSLVIIPQAQQLCAAGVLEDVMGECCMDCSCHMSHWMCMYSEERVVHDFFMH